MAKPEGLLKISELAAAAQVSVSTLKYYVREGLVEIACKTGRNMAYYAPESVERVKLIKMLQTERFYPLQVIKGLLKGGIDMREVELLDVIHKSDHANARTDITSAEARKRSGLSREGLDALIAAGLIRPRREGRRQLFSDADCTLMQLARRREQAGIPLGQTVTAFCAYDAHLRTAASADIEALIARAFLEKPLDTRAIVNIIRTSDDTLDKFIALRRYAINRALGSAQLNRISAFAARLDDYVKRLCEVLERYGYQNEAGALQAALAKGGEDAAGIYGALLSMGAGRGLSASLALCHKANLFYAIPANAATPEGLIDAALALGFKACAPQALTPPPTPEQRTEFMKNACDTALAQAINDLQNKSFKEEDNYGID